MPSLGSTRLTNSLTISLGVKKLPPVYWTFGKYDAIGLLEAPNDEAAMEFELKLGNLGNVRTTTLRAFTEEEIARVVDKLG
jgi:uncharacterized protein with GYD domain